MKKIFLMITFFAHTTLYSSNSNFSHKVRFSVPEKYGIQHGEIKSYNTSEVKILTINFFGLSNNPPITIRYWVKNTNENKDFENISLWSYRSHTTPNQIDYIFNNAREEASTATMEHLSLLQRIFHCTTTSTATFEPLPQLRLVQKLDACSNVPEVTDKILTNKNLLAQLQVATFSELPQRNEPRRRQREESDRPDNESQEPMHNSNAQEASPSACWPHSSSPQPRH